MVNKVCRRRGVTRETFCLGVCENGMDLVRDVYPVLRQRRKRKEQVDRPCWREVWGNETVLLVVFVVVSKATGV